MHGRIRDKYEQTGGVSGFGYPLTDELPTPDGIGRFNHFQGCSIYWTEQTNAHEVHGAIRERWAQLGSELSYLGYPISDEIRVGDSADHRYSLFQGGSIVWTKQTGARDYHTWQVAAFGDPAFPPGGLVTGLVRQTDTILAALAAGTDGRLRVAWLDQG